MPNYRSGFERTVATQLTQAKVTFEFEKYVFPYVINHEYTPDFRLGNGIFVEAKGKLRKEDRAKLIAVKAQYPELDLRLLFMRGSESIAGGRITNAQWAERNGFIWAEGRMPESWYA